MPVQRKIKAVIRTMTNRIPIRVDHSTAAGNATRINLSGPDGSTNSTTDLSRHLHFKETLMASPVSALNGSSSATNPTTTSAAAAAAASAPSESMFLNLLVSQMKNQDPLNPTDSTQFVSQLAQFSELEQVIGIRADTDQLSTAATAAQAASAANTTPSPTTSATA
jgi:hypothetical protein